MQDELELKERGAMIPLDQHMNIQEALNSETSMKRHEIYCEISSFHGNYLYEAGGKCQNKCYILRCTYPGVCASQKNCIFLFIIEQTC